jgi:17beta-estradiol 17-dehydrogenase / very-long-chain 3-oxoacyl-CoA reductase
VSSLQLKKYGAGKGAWAVITGASEGIGREYALQLAKKSFNVLVLARNKAALNALANEIGALPYLCECGSISYI